MSLRSRTPDIDPNRSFWTASARSTYEPLSPLVGKTTADVAIVGGGLTGVSTAYHLIRRFPHKRILLLEARTLANGASGRNGGLMLNWINGGETDVPEEARRIYDTTRSGLDLIEQILTEHELDVRWRRDGCMEVLTDPRRAEAASARAEQLRSWGIPLEFLSGRDLAARANVQGAYGAFFDRSEGLIDSAGFVHALRPVLLEAGVAIHEGTPVLRVREGSTVVLTTPEAEVRAAAVVLATDSYSPQLGYFKSGIFPLHSHVIATEPIAPEARAAAGWGELAGFYDDIDRISFGGLVPGGGIVFGGGSNASYAYLYGNRTQYPGSPESAPASFEAVRRKLAEYLPGTAGLRVGWRWTGTIGITMSRMCSMGVRGQARNVYYALGYSGHGITLAVLAGRVLCDLYSDHHEPWRLLPFYQKPLRGIPPEPFRWMGYHLYTKLTGRSPRRSI